MKTQQKFSIAVLTMMAAGLFMLITSHRPANSAENKSGWQLKPPPSAASYGAPPLEIKPEKKSTDVSPTHDEVKDKTESPTGKEPESPGKEKEGNSPVSPRPSWTLKPPSSAAGYGAPPREVKDGQDSPVSSSPVANTLNNGTATTHQPAPQEPAAQEEKSGPTMPVWTIEPPPSAAGYGK